MFSRGLAFVCALMASAPFPAMAGGVPAAPEDGGPRNWEVLAEGGLNLRAEASTRSTVLAKYAAGTLLDNLGCKRVEGRVWCDVQPLGGGPRGYAAAEFLRPAVAPHGVPAFGPDDSAYRAGQGDFDASGKVPCAEHSGQPMGQCDFAVARAGGGYATVVVTHASGAKRAIYFRMGIPIGVSMSEANRCGPYSASKEGDLNMIRCGNERFEVPDAVVLGG